MPTRCGSRSTRGVRRACDRTRFVLRVRDRARGTARSTRCIRDDDHIAFLPDVHVLRGYVLVRADRAPRGRARRTSPSTSTSRPAGHVRPPGRARARRACVPTERIYVLSLGSKDGNAHVHWHVAALPPGVPYEDQQYRALMSETKGVLAMTDADQRGAGRRLASGARSRCRLIGEPWRGPSEDAIAGDRWRSAARRTDPTVAPAFSDFLDFPLHRTWVRVV